MRGIEKWEYLLLTEQYQKTVVQFKETHKILVCILHLISRGNRKKTKPNKTKKNIWIGKPEIGVVRTNDKCTERLSERDDK